MYKALNLDPDRYSKTAKAMLQPLVFVEEYDHKKPLESIIANYDILILRFARRIDAKLLALAKNLQVITCNATGVDHIDAEAAASKGITVLSLQGETDFLEGIHATAELTWALLLSLVRKIPTAQQHTTDCQWQRNNFYSFELYAKSIGILGYGRIGKKVATFAEAFGMKVFAYDTRTVRTPEYITMVSSAKELASLVDVLSIHVSYDSGTHNLVDQEIFKQLPLGAYLINTSRGAVVDEVALLRELQTGHLAGAALDVLNHEQDNKFLQDNPLVAYAKDHDNLLITPHIGGVTKESWEKTEVFMANKLLSWLNHLSNKHFGT